MAEKAETSPELKPLARRYLVSVALILAALLGAEALMETSQREVRRIEAERDQVAARYSLLVEIMLVAHSAADARSPPGTANPRLGALIAALQADRRCPRAPEDVLHMPERIATLYVDGLPSLCFRADRFLAAATRLAIASGAARRDLDLMLGTFPALREGLSRIRIEYAEMAAAAEARRALLGRALVAAVIGVLGLQAWFVMVRGGRMLSIALANRAMAHRTAMESNHQLRRHIREAESAKAEAERSNRLKDEFLARLSHEIRTPLNAIIGFSDLLMRGLPEIFRNVPDGALEDGAQEVSREADDRARLARTQISQIQRSGAALLALFEDSLEIARLQSGDAQLEPAPLDIGAVVDALALVHRPLAEAKGLTFDLAIDPALPRRWITDGERLRRMISALVDNAVKFSDCGAVRLEMRPWGDVGVLIAVEDEGPGVPIPQREEVFRSFYQVDGSSRRRHGGIGQGLTLARAIARAMGGEIGVGAARSGGARFWLRLPMLMLGGAKAAHSAGGGDASGDPTNAADRHRRAAAR